MSPNARWKLLAAAGLVLVTCGLAQLGGGAPAYAAPSCPGLYVLAVPGTWETSDADPRTGMLAASVDALPGDVGVGYIAYTATAFPWEGEVYGRSKRTGHGVVAPDRIALVGLISDPRRVPPDTLIGPPVVGAGAGGQRPGGFGLLGPRTHTFCAAGDLYRAMPEGDFAGRIAGFFVEISNPDPAMFDRYTRDAVDLVDSAPAAGGLGLPAGQLDANAVDERKAQIAEFVNSGVHQSYPFYVVGPDGETALSWLRRRLVDLIGK
ncbi:cutinase family protein [Nocardia africana]